MFSQPSPKEYIQGYIQDAHVRERDPVSQKEKCSTRELELVSLITKELLVLGGWIHFVPSLGIWICKSKGSRQRPSGPVWPSHIGEARTWSFFRLVTPRSRGYGDVTATYIRRSELPSRIYAKHQYKQESEYESIWCIIHSNTWVHIQSYRFYGLNSLIITLYPAWYIRLVIIIFTGNLLGILYHDRWPVFLLYMQWPDYIVLLYFL